MVKINKKEAEDYLIKIFDFIEMEIQNLKVIPDYIFFIPKKN